MKRVYINAASCLSPQKTFDGFSSLKQPEVYNSNLLWLQDPDYKKYINPVQIRRMSRINKMGLTAARMCLENAANPMPDAIITGTGYGCIAETRQCMRDLIDSNEANVVPNQFMQTTQNSVAGLIALGLKCNDYNFTYVQRGFSFEHALMDAVFQIQHQNKQNVLLGSLDENTEDSIKIYARLKQYKTEAILNTDLYNYKTEGSIKGEGSCFYLLQPEKKQNYSVEFAGVQLVYKPSSVSDFEKPLKELLQGTKPDICIAGYNGDAAQDEWYQLFKKDFFPNTTFCRFKHLTGEYATSSSFAFWSALQMLQHNEVPDCYMPDNSVKQISSVLIYNHYFGRNHSFILLKKS